MTTATRTCPACEILAAAPGDRYCEGCGSAADRSAWADPSDNAPRPAQPAQAPRSTLAATRNPLLGLEAVQRLQAMPPECRAELSALLLEIRRDAMARAEKSWRQHKGPMAAYWRAVGVYAGHTSRAVR